MVAVVRAEPQNFTLPRGYKNVQRHIRMFPERLLVEMLPVSERTEGGIQLMAQTLRKKRPGLCFVLSSGSPLFKPGQILLINPHDGKRMVNWRCPGYHARQEVRALGIVCVHLGRPIPMPLAETVMATFDADFKPTLQTVHLRLSARKEKSDKGIELPDSMKVRADDTGEVVEVGSRVTNCTKGQRVFFQRQALYDFGFDGDPNSALIHEDGIYGEVH